MIFRASLDKVSIFLFRAFYFVRDYCLLYVLNKLIPFLFRSYGTNNPIPVNAVVITGASSGIGKDAAIFLAEQGYMVFAGMRNIQDSAELLSQYEKSMRKGLLYPIALDVSNQKSIKEAVKVVEDRLKSTSARLIGLVSNAGISKIGLFEYISIQNVQEIMNVNFIGTFSVVQAFLPLLRANSCIGSRIIITSTSMYGIALPYSSAYSASKYAVEGMADCLRRELSFQNIYISILEPGIIKTKMQEKIKDSMKIFDDEQSIQQKQDIMKNYKILSDPYQYFTVFDSLGGSTIWTSHTIQHALQSPFPKSRYLINADAHIFYWLKFLPDNVLDFLILMIHHLVKRVSETSFLSKKKK